MDAFTYTIQLIRLFGAKEGHSSAPRFAPPCPELKKIVHRQSEQSNTYRELTKEDLPEILRRIGLGEQFTCIAQDFNTHGQAISLINRGLHKLQKSTSKRGISSNHSSDHPYRQHRPKENDKQ